MGHRVGHQPCTPFGNRDIRGEIHVPDSCALDRFISHLIMHGILEKMGHGLFGRWQTRFFRMENFSLLYFESETETDGAHSKTIDLRQLKSCGFGSPQQRELCLPESR